MSNEISDFKKDVIEKSLDKPVLVDFWAEWCAPCKILGPILEKLASESNGEWALAKLDTDKNQSIAAEFGIRGIPNCKLFFKGKVINEFTGALPEYQVKEWLKKSLPSKYVELIEQAKNLIDANHPDKAKEILEHVLQKDNNNIEVKILLAKIKLFEDPAKVLNLISNVDGSGENLELAESIQTLAELLIKKDLPEGEGKIEYESAIQAIKNKNFDEALGKLINVIRLDRQFDNDGARKVCIAIFKYLGEEHEITQKHRRDFGSALYI